MGKLVTELKDKLEASSEFKTDNKAWLRRRLHACTAQSCATIYL